MRLYKGNINFKGLNLGLLDFRPLKNSEYLKQFIQFTQFIGTSSKLCSPWF